MKMNTKNMMVKGKSSGLLLALILVLIVIGGIGSFFLIRSTTLEDSLAGDRVVNTLFIIENGGKPLGTYAFFSYPNTRRGVIFDIPQNIGLIIRTLNRVDRIDSVYDPAHPDGYRREIERLLGISLTYLVVIDMNGLRSLIDLIEGIEINIPEAIADFSKVPPVLLPAGRVLLDGDKAQIYLDYNASDDEAEQLWAKREGFFLKLIQKIGEQQAIFSNQAMRKYFYASLKNTMTPRTVDRLFETLARIDTEKVAVQAIGGNYRDVSGEWLLFPFYDGSLIKDIVSEALSGLVRAGDSTAGGRLLTVEVLNGTSVTGLAGRTAELLRSFGYDVINIGNTDNVQYDKTQVIDRSGMDEYGRIFADVINCKNILVESPDNDIHEEGIGMSEADIGYNADFTLILGRDFNGRYADQ